MRLFLGCYGNGPNSAPVSPESVKTCPVRRRLRAPAFIDTERNCAENRSTTENQTTPECNRCAARCP
jgi:hypothetical protein